MQKQLKKQVVEQKVDLEYNIDFLGRAISKAEMYAFRFGDQNKARNMTPRFGYYNRFNNNTEKERMKLFKSFVNSVKFVDYGFEETEDKFNEIIFPANMTKEDIMKYVIDLSSLVNSPQEKQVYNDLINTILRLQPNFDNYKDLFDKNAQMDIKQFKENYVGMSKAFGEKEHNWTKKYEENPDHMPGFELDKKFEDDKEFSKHRKKKNNETYQ